MCGIVGYVGGRPALEVVLDGLRRLEYRGYDSAGVAILDGAVAVHRKAGKLSNLEKELADTEVPGTTGMGHTRWATHGAPTDRNAHPHTDCSGRVAVIHNGIIENFSALRAELEAKGHELASDTDTEVVAHMVEDAYDGDLAEALRTVCRRLEGAYSLVVVHAGSPGVVAGARRHSPLVVGVGDGERFLASDVTAFLAYTRDALEIADDQLVEITSDGVTVTDLDGNPIEPRPFTVDWDAAAAEKGGYDFFMLKEIEEQPQAVRDTLRGRIDGQGHVVLDEVRLSDEDLRDVDKVFVVACGSAYHAGLLAKYAIEHWTRIACEVEIASEFRYRDPVLDRSTLVVAISQSGETIDTLMAVKHARTQRARVLAITNVVGSTLARESDAVLYTRAGPEVGVAATKTFTTQMAATYLVALHLARVRGTKYADEVAAVVRELDRVPELIERCLANREPVRALARDIAGARDVLFVGRHVGYPMALEGALKLKELSYLHAEGFPAGELKHGSIALVEEGVPVVSIVPRGELRAKVVSNMQEIRTRGGRNIAIAVEGDREVEDYADDVIWVPVTPTLIAPLVTVVPLQVLACEVALARGLDIDQPRNLAKSVTVE